MTRKRGRIVETELVCPECNWVSVIQRKQGREKAEGHIKHMYCPGCGKIQPHEERKPS